MLGEKKICYSFSLLFLSENYHCVGNKIIIIVGKIFVVCEKVFWKINVCNDVSSEF